MPSTQIDANKLINSLNLSYFAAIILPLSYIFFVIIRFKVRAKLIRNPFLSQLYMFLAVIL